MRSIGCVAMLLVAPATARAEHDPTGWRLDLGLRGAVSIAPEASAPSDRVGVGPSFSLRAMRRVGAVHVGAVVAAGAPAYYGRHELAASLDRELVLRGNDCGAPRDGTESWPACPARLTLAAGVDAGVGMLFHDAPPETPALSNALSYWGPFARGHLAFRAQWRTPNDKQIGLAVGAGLAATHAHYTSTAGGTGARVEPSLEVGMSIRL